MKARKAMSQNLLTSRPTVLQWCHGFKHVENQACKHTLRKRLYSPRRESRVRKEIRLQLSFIVCFMLVD